LKRDLSLAKTALSLHKDVIGRVQKAKDRTSDDSKVLRQALGFTLCVVVAEIGEEGFDFMRALSATGDGDLSWIARENLKKDRLKKNYPKQVKELESLSHKTRGTLRGAGSVG
jgi:hypothetical protein